MANPRPPPRRPRGQAAAMKAATTVLSSSTSSSSSVHSLALVLLLFFVTQQAATASSFCAAFTGGMSPPSSSSFFGRGLIRSQAMGAGSGMPADKTGETQQSGVSKKQPINAPPTSPPSSPRSASSIPSRLLEESAAAGAAVPSFTLGEMLQRDRQAVTSLPAPPQDISQDKEMLEELTHIFYRAVNERQPEVLAKLWLEDEESVVLCAGDGNVTRGYSAVNDWLNVLRKEERKLDPGKKGLMLHPTTEISDLRVVINGLHAWVTCKEVMPRGLLKDMPVLGDGEFYTGTNVFRKWNGQWRLMTHFSGRLAPIQEQLSVFLEAKKAQQAAKQQGGGKGGAGGPNIQRIPLRPEDLGLPPGLPLDAEAEITWEMDDEFGEEDEDVEGLVLGGEGGGRGSGGGGQQERLAAFQDLAGSLMEWNRQAVFRKKTKKALSAVRKLFKEGRLTRLEKVKLIHSVIYATSQEEVSQVEMAYDLLVKEYEDEAEFSEQLKLILNSLED